MFKIYLQLKIWLVYLVLLTQTAMLKIGPVLLPTRFFVEIAVSLQRFSDVASNQQAAQPQANRKPF